MSYLFWLTSFFGSVVLGAVYAEESTEESVVSWDFWRDLQPEESEHQSKRVQLRADSDADAVYFRYQIEAGMDYQLYQENQPAWKLKLVFLAAVEENAQDSELLQLEIEDDSRREYDLENGIRILETEEFDGAQRVEIRIPRALLGERVPWNTSGPAVSMLLNTEFSLADWSEQAPELESFVELEAAQQRESEESQIEEEQTAAEITGFPWLASNRFALCWQQGNPSALRISAAQN